MRIVPEIELVGIQKRFGSVLANEDIHLSVMPGTLHAIVGENGAGKSTAMKILYGICRPDAGELRIRGKNFSWKSPADAIAQGIGMVHQHFMLAGPASVLENILVGAEDARDAAVRRRRGSAARLITAFLPVDLKSARTRLEELISKYGFAVDLDARVESLPVGVQQRVEILKLLYREARTLILDEPTAVLTPQEIRDLFVQLKRLAAEGKSVIVITHKLKEVMQHTSRVTVFRTGKVVADLETLRTSEQELASLMVGRKVNLRIDPPPGE